MSEQEAPRTIEVGSQTISVLAERMYNVYVEELGGRGLPRIWSELHPADITRWKQRAHLLLVDLPGASG